MIEPYQPDVSILVCAYNMARELPRTLYTLSKSYQRDCEGMTWEVVVLDNGSDPPVDATMLQSVLPGVTVARATDPKPCPAAAINAAMADLRGNLGLWIDGATLASPGILHHAISAWRCDFTRAIGTLAFDLGDDVQVRTVADGYDAHAEDALLDSVSWESEGYRLFDIAVSHRRRRRDGSVASMKRTHSSSTAPCGTRWADSKNASKRQEAAL